MSNIAEELRIQDEINENNNKNLEIQKQNDQEYHEQIEKELSEQKIIFQEQAQQAERELQEKELREKRRLKSSPDLFDMFITGLANKINETAADIAKHLHEEKLAAERQVIIEDIKLQAERYIAEAKNKEMEQKRITEVQQFFEKVDKELHHIKHNTTQERLEISAYSRELQIKKEEQNIVNELEKRDKTLKNEMRTASDERKEQIVKERLKILKDMERAEAKAAEQARERREHQKHDRTR